MGLVVVWVPTYAPPHTHTRADARTARPQHSLHTHPYGRKHSTPHAYIYIYILVYTTRTHGCRHTHTLSLLFFEQKTTLSELLARASSQQGGSDAEARQMIQTLSLERTRSSTPTPIPSHPHPHIHPPTNNHTKNTHPHTRTHTRSRRGHSLSCLRGRAHSRAAAMPRRGR